MVKSLCMALVYCPGLTCIQEGWQYHSLVDFIGYNLNVMRQSVCLVFNPIMVDNYAAFFNCTPVGRASDSMMAPT